MYTPDRNAFSSRSIASLYFLVVAALLLVTNQLTGTAAGTGPRQTGALRLSMIEGNEPLAPAAFLIGPDDIPCVRKDRYDAWS